VATIESERLAEEYATLRTACGLLDASERGKLALTGAGAVEFLNGQITNELADLRPGEGRYAAFLTNKGKMLGDLRVLAVGAESAVGGDSTPGEDSPAGAGAAVEELLLDTERVALQALFDMIRRYRIGYEVELHKRTLESALLSLTGPDAHAVAARALPAAAAILPATEHAHVGATVAGRPVRVIATDAGGLDVLCASADRETVYEALVEAGARPVGPASAEIVRVERGRPRFGVDLDESTIPQEAGLNERAVSFTKGCYVGQETVARLHYRGKPNRHLRGLRITDPTRPAAPGDELRLGERVVGQLTSAVLSPIFGSIGLALVRREAAPGSTVTLGAEGPAAVVLELPFR
jgi:tRNA-modifying protein YgfZ